MARTTKLHHTGSPMMMLPLVLGGVLLVLGVPRLAEGRLSKAYWRGDLPRCGEGFQFFKDFMKCDASLHYCFEYRNDSCVGPSNWMCVHNLNRKADIDGAETDVAIKNQGFGNTRCCGGKYQSPINIHANTKCVPGMSIPTYHQPSKILIGNYENNGYYPKFHVEAEKYVDPLILTGVPFTCSVFQDLNYVFTNIHIHSGLKGSYRSAHFVQGKSYDAEFHIVHMHEKFWSPGSLDSRCASQTPLGLAVIGVFLSLTEGEPNAELNRMLEPENLEKIREASEFCPYDKICNLGDGSSEESSESASSNESSESRSSESSSSESRSSASQSSESASSDSSESTSSDSSSESMSSEDDDGDFCEDIDDIEDFFDFGDLEFDDKRKKRSADLWKILHGGNRRQPKNDRDTKKVVCFCRQKKFEEIIHPWAGRGEELQCRRKYTSGGTIAMDSGRDAAGGTNHQSCNQHGNGESCGEGVIEDFLLRPGLLLPRRKDYWQYFGSLTTPPCSEVVNWMVMKQPIRITREQLANLHKLESRREGHLISEFGDVRPLQPINGRTVLTNSCH